MAKKKFQSAFFCQSCGTQSPKWLGKCPQCGEWNTFVEEVITKEEQKKTWSRTNRVNIPVPIKDIAYTKEQRIQTKDSELKRE